MNSRACIAAVALVLAGTQGHAQTIFKDGNTLIEEMRQFEQAERNAPHDKLSTGIYMGYVVGVADASSGITWCPGGARNRVSVGQIASTVLQYMSNNPDKWHLEAAALVMNALQQAFPCKK